MTKLHIPKICFLFCLLLSLLLLSACGETPDAAAPEGPAETDTTGGEPEPAEEKAPETFTVTWKNFDGTVLKVDTVEAGTTPAYSGTPTRGNDQQYIYTFSGWLPEVAPVTGNVVYTAKYGTELQIYQVMWFDYNGRVLKTEQLEYGETPVYTDPLPERPSDVDYDYIFSKWSSEPAPVKGNAGYTAQYIYKTRYYTVTWQNYDGTVLKTEQVRHSALKVDRSIRPENPGKTFCGWAYNGALVFDAAGQTVSTTLVTGDMTVVAEFR